MIFMKKGKGNLFIVGKLLHETAFAQRQMLVLQRTVGNTVIKFYDISLAPSFEENWHKGRLFNRME